MTTIMRILSWRRSTPPPTVRPEEVFSVECAEVGGSAHCWECRRRRLVCDGTKPICKRCRAAGIVCPGYADRKPLTWLAPGRVVSRPRKKRQHRDAAPSGVSAAAASNVTEQPRPQPQEQQRAEGCPELGTANDGDSSETNSPGVAMVQEIRPEIYDLFEAVEYYNTRIYPELAETELAPNRFVAPVAVVEAVSSPVLHMLVSAVISHRIIQSAEHPTTDRAVKPLWRRLYRHRDIAIRGARMILATEEGRKGFEAVSVVFTLLYTMLQQSYTPCWHIHANGFRSLLQFHGSLPDLVRKYPFIEPSLMALCIINIFANSTSPRNSQILLASPEETFCLIDEYYTETYFPSILCPPPLLVEVVWINHLRGLPPGPETACAAALCLARIEAFDPLSWCTERAASANNPEGQDTELPRRNGQSSSNSSNAKEDAIGNQSPTGLCCDQHLVPVPTVLSSDVNGVSFFGSPPPPPLGQASSSPPNLAPKGPYQQQQQQQPLDHPPPTDEAWMWLNAALRTTTSGPQRSAPPSHPGSDPHRSQDWLNLTTAYHAATFLYALLALQSAGVLPAGPSSAPRPVSSLSHLRAHHACRLRASLAACVASPRTRRRVVWPLVVAGVEAGAPGWIDDDDEDAGGGGGDGSPDARERVRKWVAETLSALAREQGAAVSEVARGVLEGFWKRGGKGGWEGCFEVAMCLAL
ncbi:hypothetical protein VTJ83DRAFT_6012 [Remersonia thermophila]|uniref:Zn(2)-C6 fungal-type domain-containing protein n=1 Tax=Remersonia thermophila TaxID=72144 RepID=A0ABR4D8L5_9PEZI